MFGFTLYSGLDLYKKLDLGNVETSLASILSMLDRIANSLAPESFVRTGTSLHPLPLTL